MEPNILVEGIKGDELQAAAQAALQEAVDTFDSVMVDASTSGTFRACVRLLKQAADIAEGAHHQGKPMTVADALQIASERQGDIEGVKAWKYLFWVSVVVLAPSLKLKSRRNQAAEAEAAEGQ